MKQLTSVILLTVLLSCAAPPKPEPPAPKFSEEAYARGIVFDDRDLNGLRDDGEPGIEGVKVSNGIDVVLTGPDGRYALPFSDDTILFVIKPRDWMTPADENHMPVFYYIHKPDGSPDQHFLFGGVEPTGPLPETVDFPLYRREDPEPEHFKVIVIADPQPKTHEELAWFARDTVNEIIGTDALFGISLGDLVDNDLDLFKPLNEVLALTGIPWYHIPGNHDINFMSPDDAHSDETFERVYGPSTYAFQYGRVHFVMLDNVIWNGFTGYKENNGLPKFRKYEGGLQEDQLRFLQNFAATVPEDDLIVLAMHIPLEGVPGHRVPQKDRLFEILVGHPHTFSISGHFHLQRHLFFELPNGNEHHHFTAGAASGNWYRGAPDEIGIPAAMMRDGTPNGYSIITFDEVEYSIRFKASRWPAGYQMNIEAPDRVSSDQLETGIEVVVNVFAGSNRSVVKMRVGEEAPWVPMERVARADPFYLKLKALEKENRPQAWRNSPNPVKSWHLWTGVLPNKLAEGIHLIEVQTTDMFGQTFVGSRPIRVE